MVGMAAEGDDTMSARAKAMGMCCIGEIGGSAGMSAKAPPPGMAGMGGPSSAIPGQFGGSHLQPQERGGRAQYLMLLPDFGQ